MKDRASIIVSICGVLLAIALFSVALVSELPPQAAQLTSWLHNTTALLTIADEVLMFATIALLAAAVCMYQKLSSRHSLSVAQVFSSLHLASIGLGVGVLAFGWALRTRIPLVVSVVVGLLQCAGTYFAGRTPIWLLIVAAVAWLGWTIVVSVALREQRKL